MTDKPSPLMKRRLNVWLCLPVLVVLIYTISQIYNVSIKEGEKWKNIANSQQLQSTVISASRGTIYDADGTVLSQSSTVYTIFADPKMLSEHLAMIDDKVDELKSAIKSERNASKVKTYQEKLDKLKTGDRTFDELVKFLAKTLDMKEETVKKRLSDENSQYVVLKKNIDKKICKQIEDKLTELGIDGVRADPTTKRVYPQNMLASNVIGHTNYENKGQVGLESYYDDYLSGVDGRIVTAKARDGTEIPYRYKQSYDAKNGADLHLNIYANVQYMLEKALDKGVEKSKPTDRACGIIMNPKTGQVYAMATNYSYDPNDYGKITNESYVQKLAGIKPDTQEYEDTQKEAWAIQWKNKAISEIYNPGSVFKIITGAAALEEKAITLKDSFTCNTKIQVEDTSFSCWSTSDHGSQNLAMAMLNSCNPAFVQIGLKLGADNFCKYLDAFGFNETTGIDLPAESNSITMPLERMGSVELGSSSFGQTNKVTPIQVITAVSAAVNGGYLVTPQVVNSITDSNGNIVKKSEPVIKRQVISKETSDTMKEVLKGVVDGQPGSNCYIQGYSIGGKSGTSQKIDEDITGQTYVASYCAFAPAEDPEVIMLVMIDHPTGEEFYGSQLAAPVCVDVLTDALPYMGFFPEYTDEELADLQISVPSVQYYSTKDAVSTLEDLGLKVKVQGSGKSVIKQIPSGVKIENGGTVVLYTDDSYNNNMVTVPSLNGLTREQAKQALAAVGLNLTAGGAAVQEEEAVAQADQSFAAGQSVPEGTAVAVTFEQGTVGSQ